MASRLIRGAAFEALSGIDVKETIARDKELEEKRRAMKLDQDERGKKPERATRDEIKAEREEEDSEQVKFFKKESALRIFCIH